MQGVLVGLGIDRHGLDAQFAAGADDAQRDFTTVRDEDLVEHGRSGRSADLDGKQALAELHGLAVLDVDAGDFAVADSSDTR